MEPVGRRQDICLPTLVVAGALCQCGQVLISQRPAGKRDALIWEYPGGKVEPGETPVEALRRELEEELGVVIRDADPISFASDAHIVLLLFACVDWMGDPTKREGQTINWVSPAEPEQHEMPPLDDELVLPVRDFMMGL